MSVEIELNDESIFGDLSIPTSPKALVLFLHGSRRSRHILANRKVARYLYDSGYATLMIDLLTKSEELIDQESSEYRFNISLLASRVIKVASWVEKHPKLKDLPIAYYGVNSGAAAALIAATSTSHVPFALISRGGRPDLVAGQLTKVSSPTLLLVGENDPVVISLNEEAQNYLTCENDLMLVKGASHLFEEQRDIAFG